MLTVFLVLLCLALTNSANSNARVPNIVNIGVVDSLTKVSVYDDIPVLADMTSGVREPFQVMAAGRERESFQILIRPSTRNVSVEFNISSLTMTSSLSGTSSDELDETDTLPSSCVDIRPVGLVFVGNATDTSRVFPMPCPSAVLEKTGGCWVMDPLLLPTIITNTTHVRTDRLVDRVSVPHAARAAFTSITSRVVGGSTLSFWVTISVPAGQTRGVYGGSIELVFSDAQRFVVPISLRVFGFNLPVMPHLQNAIQLDIAHLHRSFPQQDDNQTATTYKLTSEWLLKNYRVNPGSIYDTWKPGDFRDYNSPFVSTPTDLQTWHDALGLNWFTIPFTPLNETQRFMEKLDNSTIANASGLVGLMSFYGFDEYSGPFDALANTFVPLQHRFPNVCTMTTAHIGMQYDHSLVKAPLPFTAATMRSLGVCAIVPQTNYLPPSANISEVQRGGIQVWTYISMQPYRPQANWRLDNPAVDARGLFWQIFDLHLDGLLFWGLNQWSGFSGVAPIPSMGASPSPNTSEGVFADLPFLPVSEWNPASYNDATQGVPWLFGDGKLLYAGVDNPIGSIRLANIRDGFDDFDYLTMLATIDGNRTRADTLARRVAGANMFELDRNTSVLQATRIAIAEIIEASIW